MEETLGEKDWSMRLRAARWLLSQDPSSDAMTRIRPAPTTVAAEVYAAPHLLAPAYSPQLYIETAKGTVQVELAVLDAPLTVENFTSLARRGYFDGLQIHRVVPAFVAGKPEGFKLFAIREGTGFARIGLCNGDVVHSVDGLDLKSPERALEVYSHVKEASHLEIALTRRGAPLTLTLDFK